MHLGIQVLNQERSCSESSTRKRRKGMQLGKGWSAKCLELVTFMMMCLSKKYGLRLLALLPSSHT